MKKVLLQIGQILEDNTGTDRFIITGKQGVDVTLEVAHDDGARSYHTAKYKKDGEYGELEFKGYDEEGAAMKWEYGYERVAIAIANATKR